MTMSSELPGVRFETAELGEIDSAFDEDLKLFDGGVHTAHHASMSLNSSADNPSPSVDRLDSFNADSHDKFCF